MSSPRNSRINEDPKKSMRENVITHLREYYFDPEEKPDEPQDLTDEIFGCFTRIIDKNITQLRKDLKQCTPEEYWQIQGGIMELKNLIKKIQSG
jgi:hypothetical protein